MLKPLRLFASVASLLILTTTLVAQQATPAKPAAQASEDYSQEAFVLEKLHSRVRFETDGTGRKHIEMRIRVISEAGVQQLGQLAFNYNAGNERLRVEAVQVYKADGSVVTAAADAVQDLSAPVAREAPVYTDLRQKHVTVPSLRPGETLEYRLTTEVHTPLAPGHFWLEHEFAANVIVLEELLEVDVPRSRAVQMKTRAGFDPTVREEGNRRIYQWRFSRLRRPTEEEKKAAEKEARKPRPPAMQMTTFQNWDEVGRWYATLERERIRITPEIRAKAAELTRGLSTSREKVQALYDFVAKNFRYVSLSFGVGRYQPHAAAEVLANQYGDCKDKHTLLAALLDAVGLRAYPVLIHSQRKVDAELPSPSQFDHVISAVPLENSYLWLDTTAEVAPFELIASPLRNKKALLIPRDGPAALVDTPADPPFAARQLVEVSGRISELGKLEVKAKYQLRGDNELALRQAFRRTPQAQWKELAQLVAVYDGLGGQVSEAKASDPSATQQPFEFEYTTGRANFLDWSSKSVQVRPPLPSLGLPDADLEDAEAGEPIELGTPIEVTIRLQLEVPGNYKARAPVPVSVRRDYGTYEARYRLEGNTLTVERHLQLTARELPGTRVRDYLAFLRAIRSDEGQALALETTVAGKPPIPETAKAEELYEAGQAALRSGNHRTAAELFERVVALEPKHPDAWNDLGLAHLGMSQLEPAANAFRKQIEANPYDEFAYNNLGRVLWRQQKYADAEAAFRKQIEISPLDRFAHANLGYMYREQRRYAEAIESLERAVAITPGQAALHVSLGQAYLNLGQQEKALAAFDRGVELAPTASVWNNVAYELAMHEVHLDRAQQYAESAVAATAAEMRNVSLDRLTVQDLFRVASLAAYWDTLGWVYFQSGALDKAEPLIQASWLLSQHGEVGDHLAQIYEKRGHKDLAVRTYAQALAASRPVPETRGRLAVLIGGEDKVEQWKQRVSGELAQMRFTLLGKLVKEKATAEFFFLFAPGPSGTVVEAVKFVRGDETLRSTADKLAAIEFPFIFPPGHPTKVVRRGTVSCSEAGGCTLLLWLPDDTTSLN